ncbi:unnamed protein product [Rotaria sp. Silwood1]|nr:unnamed protein product [Rotaria sp. Silwood1]CAF1663677.1 unnamed protein product [Rotaria sp. Silwood1]CAF3926070.1 unnamed protein product [Rotaria sp. Silwood1]CAF3933571.1 unnamed protein product [Rotaria sp. Silwood1]CAF4008596.1 unnamed protein product [Rotaria sp. Silwood1]
MAEPNQDYSRLVREKAKELEKQIELFEKENAKLQFLCNEHNLAIKKLKQDHDEFEKTKQKVLILQEDLKQPKTRWSTTINRLKERIEILEYENAELKQEKEIIERKRLDLMHQLQTLSKQQQQQQQLQEDTSSLSMTRKSLVELQ